MRRDIALFLEVRKESSTSASPPAGIDVLMP